MTAPTSRAVVERRLDRDNLVDLFPTPPWATRALIEQLGILGISNPSERVWEPASGRGDMARVLAKHFARVVASDLYANRHGYGGQVDFLKTPRRSDGLVDWIITNPPFRLAEAFALHTLTVSRPGSGVALLVRATFMEGVGRHRRLFEPYPPTHILQFTERVPMLKDRLIRTATTATAYCWLVWSEVHGGYERNIAGGKRGNSATRYLWIPPCRRRLERDGDYDDDAGGADAGTALGSRAGR